MKNPNQSIEGPRTPRLLEYSPDHPLASFFKTTPKTSPTIIVVTRGASRYGVSGRLSGGGGKGGTPLFGGLIIVHIVYVVRALQLGSLVSRRFYNREPKTLKHHQDHEIGSNQKHAKNSYLIKSTSTCVSKYKIQYTLWEDTPGDTPGRSLGGCLGVCFGNTFGGHIKMIGNPAIIGGGPKAAPTDDLGGAAEGRPPQSS